MKKITRRVSFRYLSFRPTRRLAAICSVAAGASLSTALVASTPAEAQTTTTTITYSADNSIFTNPERGFYHHYMPPGGGPVGQQDTPHGPLSVSELRALRSKNEAITIVRDSILIPRKFWTQPISPEYLNQLQANFDAIREAGLKCVPRFLYDWGMQNRDPQEAVISRHLNELKPLLHKNADVIAWVQGGLFGGTGEGAFSDQGHVVMKHKSSSGTWQGLSASGQRLWLQELRAIPADRMMTVRYPRLKWDLFGWNSQSAPGRAMDEIISFDGSEPSRVGFYNDGFMGSAEHYAMFQLPNEAQFTADDASFVVHEGEISDASEYKLKNDQVVIDVEKYHLTSINAGGDDWAKVSQAWRNNGDYDTVARKLGYRFRMIKAALPPSVRAGGNFSMSLELTNDGVAKACNPRGIEIVLRSRTNGFLHRIKIDKGDGNRVWLPGPGQTQLLEVNAGLPTSLPVADYDVLLNLPDPYPSLYERPEYSIRLANQNVWEATTGFNKLQHTVRITAPATGTNDPATTTTTKTTATPTPTPAPTPTPTPAPTTTTKTTAPATTAPAIPTGTPAAASSAKTTAGLSATYYDNDNFTGTKFSRVDGQVNFNWGTGSPMKGIANETFSVRWKGLLKAQHSQTYTFYTATDDGVRLWVGGKLIINQWKPQTAAKENVATIKLVAGKKYDIVLEYCEKTVSAVAQLRWSSPSTPKAIVPQAQLSAPVN